MANLTPTFYTIKARMSGSGLNDGDVHKSIFNLWKAVAAIANNLDDDGVGGSDYMSSVGTDLNTAMANVSTPPGPTAV